MRRGGGKSKGSSFERKICKALSLWVSHGEREDLFWRSSISGGRATVQRRNQKTMARHAGDISATSAEGTALTDVFLIECKHVKDLNLECWMMQESSAIGRFWEKAEGQALEHHLEPMLICRQNLSPRSTVVLVDSKVAKGYAWARDSAVARVMTGPFSNAAVLNFEQMLKQRFSMRIT